MAASRAAGKRSVHMKLTLLAALFLCVLASAAAAQPKLSPLDKYLNDADVILIAKCLSVGPVNILLRADVRVEVLLVVKGAEKRTEMTVHSQYGMQPGKRYLLRLDGHAPTGSERYFARTRDSVIEVSEGEDINELKTLSPRIIVLRTMNLRVYRLESEISSLTYELDAIKAARQNE